MKRLTELSALGSPEGLAMHPFENCYQPDIVLIVSSNGTEDLGNSLPPGAEAGSERGIFKISGRSRAGDSGTPCPGRRLNPK
jgi:hypothetical protein